MRLTPCPYYDLIAGVTFIPQPAPYYTESVRLTPCAYYDLIAGVTFIPLPLPYYTESVRLTPCPYYGLIAVVNFIPQPAPYYTGSDLITYLYADPVSFLLLGATPGLPFAVPVLPPYITSIT